MAGRGRPRKLSEDLQEIKAKIEAVDLVQMKDISFDESLFKPHKTNTLMDNILSTEGGVFPGTNIIVAGDPGVGKSTVLLDMLANLKKEGKDVLFISAEMNEIELYPYVVRYPKFSELDILFMHEYSDDTQGALDIVLQKGYDVVLIDSWAEIIDTIMENNNSTKKPAEKWLLDLMDKHNKANNEGKKHTAFISIQQMTKGGDFAGSKRIQHMTTAFAFLKFDGRGRDAPRYIVFSKNRRGDVGERMYFNLMRKEDVEYYHDTIN